MLIHANLELQKLLQADPAFRAVLERMDRDGTMRVAGLKDSSRAFFIASLYELTKRTVAVLCGGVEEAHTLAQDTAFFAGSDAVLLMPPWDLMLPDTLSPQKDVERERIRVLSTLIEEKPAIVVIPRMGLLQKVVPRGIVAGFSAPVSMGDTIDRDDFAAKLIEGGTAGCRWLRKAAISASGGT